MREFAERCRRRIADLGLNDAEAARRIGISERRFGHYLTPRPDTGKLSEPDLQMVLRIAAALQTHPNYLLGVSEDPDRRNAADSRRINVLERELAEVKRRLDKMQQ